MDLRKNTKRLYISIVVLVAILIVFLVIKLLLPKNAVDFYINAEKRNLDRIIQWADERYTGFIKRQMPYMEETHRRRVEITANLESGGEAFGLGQTDQLSGILKKCKLIVDTKKQPQEGNSLSNLSLLVERAPFIDAELFSDKRALYATVPVLTPGKYFSARLDQLDEVYDKYSIPIKPKKLVSAVEIAQALEFDGAVIRNSIEKLSNIAAKYLTKNTVKYGGNREILISGEKLNGREVLVSLDEALATALLYELADSIVDDGALIRYTYGNYANLSSLANDMGLFRLFEYMDETGTVLLNESEKALVDSLSKEKHVEDLERAFKETIRKYIIKDGFNMTLLIDNDGNILLRNVILELVNEEDNNSLILDIGTGSSSTVFEDARNRALNLVLTEKTADSNMGNGNNGETMKVRELHILPVFEKVKGAGTKGSVAIEYAYSSPGEERVGFDLDIDISSVQDELTLKWNKKIGFDARVFMDTGVGNLQGELINSTWENNKLKSRNSTSEIRINVDMPFIGVHDFSVGINLAGEDRFAIEPFTLPDVQSSAVTDLNEATQEDLDKIKTEIMASFGSFYFSNKPLFDAFLGQ